MPWNAQMIIMIRVFKDLKLIVMTYLSSRNKIFTPVSKINIGDIVCYKNGNGNWYKGVVTLEEDEHQCMLAPRTKRGVIVDYGDISLIQEMKDLFMYETKSKNKF